MFNQRPWPIGHARMSRVEHTLKLMRLSAHTSGFLLLAMALNKATMADTREGQWPCLNKSERVEHPALPTVAQALSANLPRTPRAPSCRPRLVS